MSDKTTIAEALAHNPNHAALVAQRFEARGVSDAEFIHTYDPISGSHKFTAEDGSVEEVLSPVPEQPKTEEPQA